MSPVQAAALEKFLLTQGFQSLNFDATAGAVIYTALVGDWNMEVAYGDVCYFRSYNNATGESYRETFFNLSHLMTAYINLRSE